LNYEEFEFDGLLFYFKSTSATAVGSTNTALGTLIMATDYDVIDTSYTNKQQMEISDFAVSGVPCQNYIHCVECDGSENVMNKMFVNSANLIDQLPDDPRFSALGNFQLATVGVQAASVIGELWVTYDVKLRKPQIQANVANIAVSTHVAATVSASSAGVATLLENSVTPVGGNGLTVSFGGAGATLLVTVASTTFNGNLHVTTTSTTTSGTWNEFPSNAAIGLGGGCTLMSLTNGNGNVGGISTPAVEPFNFPSGNTTSARNVIISIASGGSLTIPIPVASTITTVDVWVSQIGNGITLNKKEKIRKLERDLAKMQENLERVEEIQHEEFECGSKSGMCSTSSDIDYKMRLHAQETGSRSGSKK